MVYWVALRVGSGCGQQWKLRKERREKEVVVAPANGDEK